MNGRSDDEVDLFVQLASACEKFHSLPRSGGIFDQDAYVMYGLNSVVEALGIRANKEETLPKSPQMTPAPNIPRARRHR